MKQKDGKRLWWVFAAVPCVWLAAFAVNYFMQPPAVKDIVYQMTMDPQSHLHHEIGGSVDDRMDTLVVAIREDPAEAVKQYQHSNSYYIRSNIMLAMMKVGTHREFLALAVEEYNHGPATLATPFGRAIGFICELVPDLAKKHDLSWLAYTDSVLSAEDWEVHPIEIDIDQWVWDGTSSTFIAKK